MKYPLLTINNLPNLYKHCGKVIVFHMNLLDNGFLNSEYPDTAKAYLKMVEEICYEQIESYFPMNAATRVYTKEGTFVIFKDTINKKMLVNFAENLMSELYSYVGDGIIINYQIMKVILFEAGRNVKLTMMSKPGEQLLESSAYREASVVFKPTKAPRGKYFSSYEEYVKKHKPVIEPQKPRNEDIVKPNVVQPEPDKKEPTEEEGYMFYI